jgi:hypothetical protein
MLYEIINPFKNINWDNPVVFLFIIFLILVFKRKWKALAIYVITFITPWFTGDYIIKNMASSEILISVPDFAYFTGGIILAFFAVISFTKYIIE